MHIYLIRHGRQSDKRCNVDVALSKEGFRQAELVGMRMKDWGIKKVYSSNMIRARQTAEYANQYWKVNHDIVPAFRELNFGDMEGLEDEVIKERFADFKALQDKMEEDIPYPGGESPGDVVKRAMPELMKITQYKLDCVAIVTHGVLIRAVLCHILGVDITKWRTVGTTFENTSITELVYHPNSGSFTMERFNDYAHLEDEPELLRSAWGVEEN